MRVRAHTDCGCRRESDAGLGAGWTISASVGLGGVNRKVDVVIVQRLLNRILPCDGGPFTLLAEDGIVGPLTLAAILGFQKFHRTASDSRVDPLGPTLKKINAVPKGRVPPHEKERLARVARSMPDLVAMARVAKLAVEEAADHLRLGGGLFGKRRQYERADLHFAFGKQNTATTLSELGFIRTTYRRVSEVLVPRPTPVSDRLLGVSIFEIDPQNKPWSAYSPMRLADGKQEHPAVHSGRVYLGAKIDEKVPDLFTHILFHELIHFVDDESEERQIVDVEDGYKERAFRLTHAQRMHNSDNYALFASHIHFGRERLVASQPTVAPHIPINL